MLAWAVSVLCGACGRAAQAGGELVRARASGRVRLRVYETRHASALGNAPDDLLAVALLSAVALLLAVALLVSTIARLVAVALLLVLLLSAVPVLSSVALLSAIALLGAVAVALPVLHPRGAPSQKPWPREQRCREQYWSEQ